MQHLTTEEKMQLKATLSKKMEEFIKETLDRDNNVGYVPHNISGLMTESAFAVLEATNSLNAYFKEEEMLKN